MYPRAQVPITLALIWTSLRWSATAHPLELSYNNTPGLPSSIVPRAKGTPIDVSRILRNRIDDRRGDYRRRKTHGKISTVTLEAQGDDGETTRKHVAVQPWNKIPNSVAYALTLETEAFPVKIPGTNTPVPVIVTSYIGMHQDYPFPPGHPDWYTCDPGAELRVAAIDPQGWDMGTAVWTHILLALKDPRWRAKLDVHDTVREIANANPKWSYMLYEKLDRILIPLGEFELLKQDQKLFMNEKEFRYLRKVIPNPVPRS